MTRNRTPVTPERTVWSRPDLGLTASVRQYADLPVHSVVSESPSILLIRRGTKTLETNGQHLRLMAGDAVALSAGCLCSVGNATDAGRFESTWIVFHEAVLAKVESAAPHTSPLRGAAFLPAEAEFTPAFDRAVQCLAEPDTIPSGVAAHRMQELLAWIAHMGVTFDQRRPADVSLRVRAMIGGAMDQDWKAGEVAAALAMSEATLRRRLTESGHSFNDLLIDVRMTAALTLLQVTDRPVSDIAFQVGYASASRFSARFKRRFGFSPALVRGGPVA